MNDERPTVTVRIHRPERENTIDEFSVPFEAHTTVLDALEWIRSREDRGLLYRHSCHHGSCGTCGMLVNGRQALACLSNLSESAREGPVELRALPTMGPIGDLAVDPEPLFRDFPCDGDYLRPSEFNKGSDTPEEIGRYERFENCIECGLCVSVCPVIRTRRFLGPAALAAYNREIEKHPEHEDELLREIDTTRGVWGCDRHFSCSRVCPTGVYPAKHIALLQKRIEKRAAGPA